mgnify:FL=1
MYCVRKVTDDLYWVGANDHRLALFENIHPIPRGVSYNSYLLLDEKNVLFDAVDWAVCRQFLENIKAVLQDKPLDYIVINHIEPDHGASLQEVLNAYPNATVICTDKAKTFMDQFGFRVGDRVETVKEGDTKCFGKHTVSFIAANMIHWPEVMATYDSTSGVLFSADAFGTFGALDGKLFNDEVDFDRDWLDDARRYGPVWRSNLEYFIEKHDKWSKYEPEEKGVLIAYASMYGNTESAAQALACKLVEKGCPDVKVYDVSNTPVSYLISDAFKYSNIVLASVTYNLGIFPVMHNFLEDMKALCLINRKFAIIENGTWAIKSGSLMENFITNDLNKMELIGNKFTLTSSLKTDKEAEMDELADAIIKSME